MNDDQLEDLLRRVRPSGPRADLRARIVSARRPERAWPWAAAAAALLFVTLFLQIAALRLRGDVRVAIGTTASETDQFDRVRAALGLSELEMRWMEMSRELDEAREPQTRNESPR
jgi:hypothetical protein